MNQQILGQILKGRYLLTDHLSAGGMGAVYKGVDTELFRRPVAVKLLHQHLAGDEKIRRQLQRRFEEEARVSTLLGEHPLIIKILDYGLQGEQPYLVMEYLSGSSLGELMQAGPMDPQRVAHLGRQICAGLYHAHCFETEVEERRIVGVVHRDIKPSNIFVLKDRSEQETIKILDFGIAKVLSDASVALGTQTTGFLGTARYASPEQMRGDELDSRSDIYSLGVVLYRMVVGELPISPKTDTFAGWFQGHHRQRPRPLEDYNLPFVIPKALSQTIMACLEKEPQARPQTMQVVGRGLAAVLSGSTEGGFTPAPMAPVLSSSPEDSDPIFSEHTLARVDAGTSVAHTPTAMPALGSQAAPSLSGALAGDLTQVPTAASLTGQVAADLTEAPTAAPAPALGNPPPPFPGSQAPLSLEPPAPTPSPSRSTSLEEGKEATVFLTEGVELESTRSFSRPPIWQLVALGAGVVALGVVFVLRETLFSTPSSPPVTQPAVDLLLPDPILKGPAPVPTPQPSPSPTPEPSPSPTPTPAPVATPIPPAPAPQPAAAPVPRVVNPAPVAAPRPAPIQPVAPRPQQNSGGTLERLRNRRDRD